MFCPHLSTRGHDEVSCQCCQARYALEHLVRVVQIAMDDEGGELLQEEHVTFRNGRRDVDASSAAVMANEAQRGVLDRAIEVLGM